MANQKQILSVLTERGDIEDAKADADIQYVTLPKDFFAWLLDYYQLAFDERLKKWVQTVSFRSKKPVQVFQDWPAISASSTDAIAEDKFDEAMAIRDNERHKDSAFTWWAIIALILLVIVSLTVLFKLN